MIKVFMGIPTTGSVCDAQGYVLRDIEAKYKDKVQLVYPKHCVRRIFHDFARNAMVDEFLASDCDVIWFLDSDIAPDKSVLDLITEHWDKWDAAGAPYPVFMSTPGSEQLQVVFTVYNGNDGRRMAPTDIPRSGTDFVDGIATGCLFLKRGVFDSLKKPYFEFKYDLETRNPIQGEDLGFCMKLNDLGIRFFIDYSKVCKHYKTVCLLDVNNYAIEFANKAVMAYDRVVQTQFATLKEKLSQRKNTDVAGVRANSVPGTMSPQSPANMSKLILPPGY